jgi:hypothetical protein
VTDAGDALIGNEQVLDGIDTVGRIDQAAAANGDTHQPPSRLAWA